VRKGGFKVTDMCEPKPIPEARIAAPNFWEIHQKIPLFMILELQKDVPIENIDLGSAAALGAQVEIVSTESQR